MIGDTYRIQKIGIIVPSSEGFALTLNAEFREALMGLSQFSHAIVLWWAHKSDADEFRGQRVLHKPYVNSPDDVGVFGSRAPTRPNPIAMSTIAVQSIDEARGIIVTPFIDTAPDTPIIDIKPYFPASDRVREATVPAWCQHWPQYYEESAAFDWSKEFT